MASALVSILLLLPVVFFVVRRRFTKPPPPLPPGPRPWPIIGNLLQIGNMPHIDLAKISQAHGPLISLRLGSQLVVVASSPAAAAEILKTNDRVLSGRHVPHVSYSKPLERNYVSLGWTYECTEQWKFLRTLCRSELFAPKVIERQATLRGEKVLEMVRFLKGKKEGDTVKIAKLVFVSSFNFLGNIFFSKDFLSFEEGEKGEMSGLLRRIIELWTAPNVSDMYPILGCLDLQGLSKKANEVLKQIFDVYGGIIEERRGQRKAAVGGGDERTRYGDFLDVLLDNEFSDDQINCLILELLTAGTDTSTSTVEWALAELMRNTKVMNKIQNELAREIQGNYVTESQLSKLIYLQACVKETLRLHPSAPLLIPRRATETCQVMNYTIPKDTEILINIWAIGRDPNIWEDPLVFNPDRFIVNSELDFKGNDFEFLPFGGGRRICPGLHMAVRQVLLTLASLIYHFDWSLPSGMSPHQLDMNEKFGVTLQKDQPLVLVPKPKGLKR